MENLTSEEVEQKIKEISKIADHGERNKAFIDLCHKVGAPPCPRDMPSVHERDADCRVGLKPTISYE